MDTIYWHMNATQGGANCAYEHGLNIRGKGKNNGTSNYFKQTSFFFKCMILRLVASLMEFHQTLQIHSYLQDKYL